MEQDLEWTYIVERNGIEVKREIRKGERQRESVGFAFDFGYKIVECEMPNWFLVWTKERWQYLWWWRNRKNEQQGERKTETLENENWNGVIAPTKAFRLINLISTICEKGTNDIGVGDSLQCSTFFLVVTFRDYGVESGKLFRERDFGSGCIVASVPVRTQKRRERKKKTMLVLRYFW